MTISTTTFEALGRAGWTPGRCTDISTYEEALTAEGYVLSLAARGFLEQFGGLVVTYHPAQLPHVENFVDLDPISTIEGVERCEVEGYEKRVHEDLVPVGQASNRYLTIMVSPSGKFYGGYGRFLCLLGEDSLEVIDHFCGEGTRKPIEIPWRPSEAESQA